MHDIGALVWVILVVIGVISSIRKNAKKGKQPAPALQQRRDTAAPAAVRPAPALSAPAPVAVPHPVRVLFEPPPTAPPVPPRIVPVAPPPPLAEAVMPPILAPEPLHEAAPGIHRARSSGLLGGIFEDKKSILRAVVAAEVLGKPKALQEQSIWSPRHSEPSI